MWYSASNSGQIATTSGYIYTFSELMYEKKKLFFPEICKRH